jgi:Tetracyclin repressor-like, C-terminal domain
MALIEAEGAQAASMTRLATELGCGLVSLYDLVPSTQALLDGVAAAVVAAVEPSAAPGASWPGEVRAQVRAVRRAATAYPRCTIAVAGRAPASAATLRPAEQLLVTLRAAGFGDADAVAILRALAAYQVGSLVREVGAGPGLRAEHADEAESPRPMLRHAAFPHLTALSAGPGRASPVTAGTADFEFGLDLLLRGMGALLDARRAAG